MFKNFKYFEIIDIFLIIKKTSYSFINILIICCNNYIMFKCNIL